MTTMTNHATNAVQPLNTSLLSEYITEYELAHELHRDVRTIRRWRAERTGPAWVQIGRRVLYKKASVFTWLDAREVRPPRACRTVRRAVR